MPECSDSVQQLWDSQLANCFLLRAGLADLAAVPQAAAIELAVAVVVLAAALPRRIDLPVRTAFVLGSAAGKPAEWDSPALD